MADELWRSQSGDRFFLIPHGRTPEAGPLSISTLMRTTVLASPEWLAPYEINEAQAHRVAETQLGDAFGELRGAMDQTFAGWRQRLEQSSRVPVHEGTTVTPNAASALVRLLKELPRAIGAGLSGDEGRVAEARRVLVGVESELKDAGIDVAGRLGEFPDRLASIRPSAKNSQDDSGDR